MGFSNRLSSPCSSACTDTSTDGSDGLKCTVASGGAARYPCECAKTVISWGGTSGECTSAGGTYIAVGDIADSDTTEHQTTTGGDTTATTFTLDASNAGIAAGQVVTGTGITGTVTVVSITGTALVLSSSQTLNNAALTFTGSVVLGDKVWVRSVILADVERTDIADTALTDRVCSCDAGRGTYASGPDASAAVSSMCHPWQVCNPASQATANEHYESQAPSAGRDRTCVDTTQVGRCTTLHYTGNVVATTPALSTDCALLSTFFSVWRPRWRCHRVGSTDRDHRPRVFLRRRVLLYRHHLRGALCLRRDDPVPVGRPHPKHRSTVHRNQNVLGRLASG